MLMNLPVSQRVLARRVGLSQPSISLWLAGQRKLAPDTEDRVSREIARLLLCDRAVALEAASSAKLADIGRRVIEGAENV